MVELTPEASRPMMPSTYGVAEPGAGKGLLPWTWAAERLIACRNYWLSTVRPDQRPHVMPIWGVWFDSLFYFSTSPQSRKARNLRQNPACTLTTDNATEAVIVEGRVEQISNIEEVRHIEDVYYLKYEWHVDLKDGPFLVIRPKVAFGFIETEEFTSTATRWTFER